MIRRDRREELTGFQEGGSYDPSYDLQTDFVMVYGIHGDFQERIRAWKEKGYVVHLMTGVSWGGYQDYLNGKIDGRTHWDEAQKNRKYENIIHGTSVDIPYMVPTIAYADFLTERIRIAVDAGVEAIHLEEPEFWVEGGYSDAFKREWEIYYREPWQAPHASVDAQYRASKLKAYLYTRTLDRICSTLKEYAMQKYDRRIRFYVPTHSLINYTQWRIVSPESKLLELPGVDGYIAQVWTGTAQTPNVYNGVRKERTFETAYLEYGIMQELVRGTDRRMWFLHDPIADDPKFTWKDYRTNYIRTLVASLLHPHVSRYEVCPWPRRIYKGEYPREGGDGKERIPASYATELQIVLNVLGTMEGQDAKWLTDSLQVGLLLADSAMYQRNHPDWSEEATSFKYDGTEVASALGNEFMELLDWSPFYGLALPLLKHGAAVRPVQLDNAGRFPGYLDDYRVLVLSYEYMKPESSGLHNVLAEWVKEGGTLIYVGDGSDDFHGVREWWNQGSKKYASPMEHLFASLGLDTELAAGEYAVGKGCLAHLPLHPSQCAISPEAGEQLRQTVASAVAAANLTNGTKLRWEKQNGMALQRGPYIIAAVLDESVSDEPYTISGKLIDLLDANLPVLDQVTVKPGEQALLYDLSKAGDGVQLIGAASRIDEVEESADGFGFVAFGPAGTQAAARFQCPRRPRTVTFGQEGASIRSQVEFKWDEGSTTLLLRYANDPSGMAVKVHW
ncbi:hypothetical protein [Paenibacillus sp. YAF4_2]|uniref:hypothetical protein n=1 Tax=Paenibacillus sp. YAF4_2 TaxID=3233085 RepID=UPI003F95424B